MRNLGDEYILNNKYMSKISISKININEVNIDTLDSSFQFSYEKIIKLTKVCKVVRGGRKYKYCALMIIGDTCGSVGFGMAKANEAPDAVLKACQCARNMFLKVPLTRDRRLIFDISGTYKATKVLIRVGRNGMGIKASNTIKSVLDALGVKSASAKVIGSGTPHNVINATFRALSKLSLYYKL